MLTFRALPLSALLLALSSAAAQSAAQPATAQPYLFGGAPFTETAAELTSVSAAVPVSREYGAQILFEQGTYRIAADGTLKYQHRLVFRVDTDATAKGWAEISANWDPWYENPAQLHARVLQPGGAFVELDQKTITDAPVKADDTETFSSQHVRRAPLPGMAVGAIVEETEETEEKTPYFAGGGLYRFGFRQHVPVARVRLIVELPSSTPFKDLIHNLPALSVTRTDADGTRRVVYESTGPGCLAQLRHRSRHQHAHHTHG